MEVILTMIEEREKKIIQFLLQSGHTRVKDIANFMKISEKTVSNSLRKIDSYLQEFNITLVRKPKVGVYLDGSSNKMYQLFNLIEYSKEFGSRNKSRKGYLYFIQPVKGK